jgi:hypothetical protein
MTGPISSILGRHLRILGMRHFCVIWVESRTNVASSPSLLIHPLLGFSFLLLLNKTCYDSFKSLSFFLFLVLAYLTTVIRYFLQHTRVPLPVCRERSYCRSVSHIQGVSFYLRLSPQAASFGIASTKPSLVSGPTQRSADHDFIKIEEPAPRSGGRQL